MKYSRRTVLKTFAALGVASVTDLKFRPARAHPCDVPVRRSVTELELDDPILETYREFVRQMREKPSTDLVSWIGFANVHGTPAGFNFCPHGNWYFLPWHRAYVHMYEVMCREMTGNAQFAMPYWDWTADRQLPKAFADETWQGQPNPLFDSTRTVPPTASLPDEYVGKTEVIDTLLEETNFELFGTSRPFGQNNLDQGWVTQGGGVQGPLESNPHNNVHCWVAQWPGHMCNSTSPRDPLFMMHHGNIDRIWAVWNARGRANTTDPLWLDMEFQDHFIAPDGTRYSKKVSDLQDYEQLGYTYDLPPAPEAVPMPQDAERNRNVTALFAGAPGLESLGVQRISVPNDKAAEATNPLSVSVRVGESVLSQAAGSSRLEAAGRAPEVLALIKDMVPPHGGNTDVRVFVNCDYLSQEVPITDPHYVATFGFFGAHGTETQHKPTSVVVNLTPALRKLTRAKLLSGDSVSVQLLPVPEPRKSIGDTGKIVPAEIEVAVV